MLCTLDQLFDSKTRINVITLKFWSRCSADFSDFNLDQVTHLSTKSILEAKSDKMSVIALSNNSFAVSHGNEEVRVWTRITVPGESAEQESRQVWSVTAALKFRDLKVR